MYQGVQEIIQQVRSPKGNLRLAKVPMGSHTDRHKLARPIRFDGDFTWKYEWFALLEDSLDLFRQVLAIRYNLIDELPKPIRAPVKDTISSLRDL